MKQIIITAALISYSICTSAQGVYHVVVNGDDKAKGTIEAPFASIEKALDVVEPGGTVYIHGGTYYPEKRIRIPEKNTTEQTRIKLFAFGDGEAIIDGSKMKPASVNEFKGSRCMYFSYDANYWHVKGLIFQNAKDNGVKVEGSYNIFERCIFRDNNDTGLQIGMFKDWSIEENKSFPIQGTPEFNPGYAYCRGNKVINCDSYNNYDAVSFSGTDDGGDADGFACKLFPGPGTEFHGCRAWNNSDDNWDLYMVYHPVVIDNCYAWNAAIDKNGNKTPGNGNGFKLGGGGSSGGAAFEQSTGAHLIKNCVAFSNTVKGFDQNNAYEGMYLLNNVAWDNEYNYRFPTKIQYGTMYMRNCIGFSPRKLNHEFLSEDKAGFKKPDTEFNSWTTIDGCDPIKDGNKINGTKVSVGDHRGEFLSLLESDAKAERLPDGSLPENNFARLVEKSRFVDAGEIISGFIPKRFMTESEAAVYDLELTQAPAITIDYNGKSADMGAYESGTATAGRVYIVSGQERQLIYYGEEIEPIVIKWAGAATDVNIAGHGNLSVKKDMQSKSVTLSGTATENLAINVKTVGGETQEAVDIIIEVSDTPRSTLLCTTDNADQTVFYNAEIKPIEFIAGGGAKSITVTGLPSGLKTSVNGLSLTITGIPEEEGCYTVTAVGGLKEISISGTISLEIANRILTGGWYKIQDPIDKLPADLNGIVGIESSSDYLTVWNTDYMESGSTLPGGCSKGAVNVERGGALVWKLPSLLELKTNVHFTGGRTLQVEWQMEGEQPQKWTSGKLKKATLLGWDIMKEAGIEPTDKPITVKFVNSPSNSGGIRIYDFFIKVYDNNESSGLTAITDSDDNDFSFYATDGALIFSNESITRISLYNIDGRIISESIQSQVLPLKGVHNAICVIKITTRDGRHHTQKIIVR